MGDGWREPPLALWGPALHNLREMLMGGGALGLLQRWRLGTICLLIWLALFAVIFPWVLDDMQRAFQVGRPAAGAHGASPQCQAHSVAHGAQPAANVSVSTLALQGNQTSADDVAERLMSALPGAMTKVFCVTFVRCAPPSPPANSLIEV